MNNHDDIGIKDLKDIIQVHKEIPKEKNMNTSLFIICQISLNFLSLSEESKVQNKKNNIIDKFEPESLFSSIKPSSRAHSNDISRFYKQDQKQDGT